jgi:hypothetical protein
MRLVIVSGTTLVLGTQILYGAFFCIFLNILTQAGDLPSNL